MADDALTPDELRSLLIEVIAGATGTKLADWQHAVGAVEKANLVFDPRTNWAVVAHGSPSQRHAIDKAVELVRAEHPYVRW